MPLKTDFVQTAYNHLLEAHITNSQKPKNAIRDFRLIFESIFKSLTRTETQTFSNLFARTVFIIDKYQLPKNITDEINGFRRFANKVAHEADFEIDERSYFTAIKSIATLLHFFSKEPIPEEILSLYVTKSGLTFSTRPQKAIELIPLAKCVVVSIGEIKEIENGTKFFTVFCEAEDELGKFSISLWQSGHNDLSALQPLLWQFCTLNIINFKKVEGKEAFYTSVPDTQVVLEPDFLIDASDIAECFQFQGTNPMLYFLSKLNGSEGNEAAFKGKLVNDHLDALIRKPNADHDEVFNDAIFANALKAAKFGQEKISKIKHSIAFEHFHNLARIATEYRGKSIRIEPTFFSAAYGIQGRLDALVEYPEDPKRKDVFELKSGKAPNGNSVWINNSMQVVCYNMLLKSTFGTDRTGNSAIFYSVAANDNLRNVPSTPLSELRVLEARNKIVFGLYHLSKCQASILDRISIARFGVAPSFKENEISGFEYAYKNASDLEKRYYLELLAFTLREHQTAKTGTSVNENRQENGFASLWLDSLEDKENRFGILHSLTFQDFDPHSNVVSFGISKKLTHNFREGDLGILYPQNGDLLQPLKHQILKGIIERLDTDTIQFCLRNKQLDVAYFRDHNEWVIEHDLFESNFWSVTQSLIEFLKAPQRLRNLILGLGQPSTQQFPYTPANYLNENQNQLIKKALEAKDYFLLQGPPGTGKTSTMLVRLVQCLTEQTSQNIVILAFTNRAVSEICNKLRVQQISFLRLNSKSSDEVEALSNNIEGLSVDQVQKHIKKHRVFVSTVSSFSSRINDLRDIVGLHTLILDEASQLTEPQVIGLLPHFEKFILIGDQNQLPAVTCQSEEDAKIKSQDLIEIGLVDLSQSLFERLYKTCQLKDWDHAFGMLESHFRMHEQIASLVNQYYSNKLVSGKQQQKEPLQLYSPTSANPLETLLSKSRTIFIQTGRHASSKTNREEAVKAAALLNTIKNVYGTNFSAATVGVVTPWRAQIALIKEFITDEEIMEKVTIDTIERFQGSEKDIIIASLAIYHPNQLQAMQSIDLDSRVDRKLLVTISRAKEQLIVLGYPQALIRSPFYQDLLDRIKIANGYIDHRTGVEAFNSSFTRLQAESAII